MTTCKDCDHFTPSCWPKFDEDEGAHGDCGAMNNEHASPAFIEDSSEYHGSTFRVKPSFSCAMFKKDPFRETT